MPISPTKVSSRSIRSADSSSGSSVSSRQPTASTRWPMDYDYTRITEFKKMTGQKSDKTTILKEIPCEGDEPFYTFPTAEWKALAQQYRDLAAQERDVIFLGRLAEYRYYDMDDVIRRALDVFENLRAAREE